MTVFNSPNPQAFTEEEVSKAQSLLSSLVQALRHVPGGGKMEEGYWSFVYHSVRGTHAPGWSNLPMRDFVHAGMGVEMKLLQRNRPLNAQGLRIMHPAATRTIAFDPTQPAEVCKVQVLEQFGAQIAELRKRVEAASDTLTADIRWGILLWRPDLSEFLYFEEQMSEPDPNDYRAEYLPGNHRGKPTRNLYIFEKETNVKRFSVTLPKNGAKVQPYFDVPKVGEGAYAFTVPNEDRQPVWLRENTIKKIEEAAAGLDLDDYLGGWIGS